jgi:6,7-dimethyl-8-ribityllumazine synthase
MPKAEITEYEGSLTGVGCRVALAVSRFNEIISKQLLSGAIDTLRRHGVAAADMVVAWVPGAFELPLVAQRLAQSGQYDAVVCLGAVIRGATPHFDLVAGQAASGTLQAGLHSGIPVMFGVLTCNTLEQALERSGSKAGNKGCDVALGALEMVQLLRQLPAHVQKLAQR